MLRKSGKALAQRGQQAGENLTDDRRPLDRMGRPSMSLTVLAGGVERAPEPPPRDLHVSQEALNLTPASQCRDTRLKLGAVADELLRDGADPAVVSRAVDRWVSRLADGEDLYPGHLRQCYSQVVAEKTITPQQRRNGRKPSTSEQRALDVLSLKTSERNPDRGP